MTNDNNLTSTGGGAKIEGDLNVDGGFIGRDNYGDNNVFNIYPGNPPTETRQTLKRISQYLDSRKYNDAEQLCKSILKSNPEHDEANLVTAICLLKGKGADRLPTDKIREVRCHLTKAAEFQATANQSIIIMGLVKYDHYRLNCMHEGEPTWKGELTLEKIRSHIEGINLIPSDIHYLKHIRASDRAYSFLGIEKPGIGS